MSKQTGLPIGTFKNMDKHPTIDGLLFRGYGKRKGGKVGEDWTTVEAMQRREERKAEYAQLEKSKKAKAILAAKYREGDPEKHREAVRRSHRKNRDVRAAYAKEYRERNRPYFAEREARRRARINKSCESKSSIDRMLIKQVYLCSKRVSECTGLQWQVDHIKPISKGGTHDVQNLQVVPKAWNQSKSNKNSNRIKTL
jgi:5-methylcytosine-specific restriction endonuclease McrA